MQTNNNSGFRKDKPPSNYHQMNNNDQVNANGVNQSNIAGINNKDPHRLNYTK